MNFCEPQAADNAAAAGSSGLLSRLDARGESAEGYLYPAVYYLREGASADEILGQIADTFDAHWSAAWDHRSDSLDLTRDEVVTLASIIEGEGPAQGDLLEISSVYHNRLNRGMRLQADPSVVFALGRRRRLLNCDYATDSSFNTYRMIGLPRHRSVTRRARVLKRRSIPILPTFSTSWHSRMGGTDSRLRTKSTFEPSGRSEKKKGRSALETEADSSSPLLQQAATRR